MPNPLGDRPNKITVQTILEPGDDAYAHDHALPGYVCRAVQALLAWRTARLGGHVQSCPEGHSKRIWYHAWNQRMGLPWAWRQVERWRAKQKARLLACDHYQVIFPLPSEVHDGWLANVAAMTQRLCAGVHETWRE